MKYIPDTPEFVILAGPNGAGKTTAASKFLNLGAEFAFVNVDEIYKSMTLGKVKHQKFHITASKIAITATKYYIAHKQSVVIETTLAGRTHLKLIEQAKKQGYFIHLFYVYLESPHIAVDRVKNRHKLGGHNIPPNTIHRRYKRSLHNLVNQYIPIVDQVTITDNSKPNSPPLTIYSYNGSIEIISNADIWETIQGLKNETY